MPNRLTIIRVVGLKFLIWAEFNAWRRVFACLRNGWSLRMAFQWAGICYRTLIIEEYLRLTDPCEFDQRGGIMPYSRREILRYVSIIDILNLEWKYLLITFSYRIKGFSWRFAIVTSGNQYWCELIEMYENATKHPILREWED